MQEISPLAGPSQHLLPRPGSSDLVERSSSRLSGIYDPSMQTRHPADTEGAVEQSEEPEEAQPSDALEPPLPAEMLPSFEESQRGRPTLGTRTSSTIGHERFDSVAAGPLARLSREAESQRSAMQETGPSPKSIHRRSFLSALLHPRSSSSSPRRSPLVDRAGGPSTSPQIDVSRSPSQPDGVGLGLGNLDEADEPLSSSSTAAMQRNIATAEDLIAMGLHMSTLTVPLPVGKISAPLCGCVLDGKYLLIGHAMGLDFLPLAPSAAEHIKRPISLIKKTRFRQLAILEERSNILLAIAGRNEHVRVYALDGVRSTIEKRLKEAMPLPLPTQVLSKADKRMSAPPTSPVFQAKGKGRADRPAPLTGLRRHSSLNVGPSSPPPAYRRPSLAKISPTRARGNSAAAKMAPHRRPSTASLAQKKSREMLGDASTPSAIALGKRRASNAEGDSVLYATAPSRNESQSGTDDTRSDEEELWVETQAAQPARRAAGMSARSPSIGEVVRDPEFMAVLADGPPLPTVSVNSPPQSPISPQLARLRREGSSPSPRQMVNSTLMSEVDHSSPLVTRSTPDSPTTITSSPLTARARMSPRSPVSDASVEDTRAMSEFLRGTDLDSSPANGQKRSPPVGTPRSARHEPSLESSRELAAFLDEGSPSAAAQARSPRLSTLMARSASVDVRGDQDTSRDLAAMLRAGPPSTMTRSQSIASSASWRTETASPAPGQRDSIVSSESAADVTEESRLLPPSAAQGEESPAGRQRKRWSMFDGILRSSTSNGTSPRTGERGQTVAEEGRASNTATAMQDATAIAVVSPTLSDAPMFNAARSPSTRSEKPSLAQPPANEDLASTAGEETDKAEAHPASAIAPLEYVKLARTKGALLFKAVETRQRTYLAVLCGEAGERIEFFTGIQNVSLSLNRTFVLPERPRNIEFQLQQDELVDIYLIYDESIFALEPNTVRVREVGVARNERRLARRERERERQRRRDASLPPLPGQEQPDRPSRSRTASDITVMPASDTTAPAQSARPSAGRQMSEPLTPNEISTEVEATAAHEKPRPLAAHCFTTFQQLPFIPPVPSSVLAPSFVIPPTYEAVLATSPSQDGSDAAAPQPPPQELQGLPLLSPISLLATHPSRHFGPPGLFLLSRGRHMTNIVDGDGRSVIRRAIKWRAPEILVPSEESYIDVFSRLEIVLAERGKRTVLVGFGPTQVQAIEVGPKPGAVHSEGDAPSAESFELIPNEVSSRKLRSSTASLRDVTFLGKTGETVYWAERAGSNVSLYALAGSVL